VKRITNILFGTLLFLFIGCGQGQVKTPQNAMKEFDQFRNKEKFIPDEKLFYPGIGDETQKPILTEKINLAADDFEKLAKSGNATDKDYQGVIGIGLNRFRGIYIDSENQERICLYFEELMDIVGLESSDGQLNDFRYGFDPTQKR